MELENLVKLIETVSASELTGLKYEENGVKLHLTKKKDRLQIVTDSGEMQAVPGMEHLADAGMAASITAVQNENAGITNTFTDGTGTKRQEEGRFIESPLVGTFYTAPAEDADPYVSVGDTVKKGQTLAIIEAMKLMNEIESEYDGIITEILVENGQPVEYGQPIFRIR